MDLAERRRLRGFTGGDGDEGDGEGEGGGSGSEDGGGGGGVVTAAAVGAARRWAAARATRRRREGGSDSGGSQLSDADAASSFFRSLSTRPCSSGLTMRRADLRQPELLVCSMRFFPCTCALRWP